MTRLEYLAKDARRLADFLDLMQSDGLQAKGCSLDLLLPDGDATWEEWLETDDPIDDEYDISAQIADLRRMVDEAAMRRGEV